MPSLLTDEIRAAILRIKSAWASRPEYGKGVLGFDIYTAVIDGFLPAKCLQIDVVPVRRSTTLERRDSVRPARKAVRERSDFSLHVVASSRETGLTIWGQVLGTGRLARPIGRRRSGLAGRVLVLGDTPNDIAAAHAAGAIGVGVTSGHSSEQELREAGADYVLASLREELPGVAEPAP